jgi:hypothetical protein
MNAITSFRLCKLSSHELIQKIDEQTDNIFKNQQLPTRHIPARPDADYDLLIGELVLRFGELESFIRSIENDLNPDTFEDDETTQDLGQLVYMTKRKISMFLAAEYGKSAV